MQENLLSIICAVYNAAPYLEACIDSIINQTYQNWELILINDGSKDNSLEICQRYADIDSRIIVYSQENKGQSAAQNKGLAICRGEYVAFLDSDDTVEPETYQAAINKLEITPQADIVQFPWHVRHYDKDILNRGPKDDICIVGTKALFEGWLYRGKWNVTNWCKIYRRHIFEGLSFKEGILFEDSLMSACVLLKAKGLCFSFEGGYNFFVRTKEKEQWTMRHSKDFIISYGSILEILLNHSVRLINARAYFTRILRDCYRKNTDAELKNLAASYLAKANIIDLWSSSLPLKRKASISIDLLRCKLNR